MNSLREKLVTIEVPIGWKNDNPGKAIANPANAGKSAVWVVVVWGLKHFFVGWLLTALAVSLGAQFWFDILKRFVSLRSAGAVSKSPSPEQGTGPNGST